MHIWIIESMELKFYTIISIAVTDTFTVYKEKMMLRDFDVPVSCLVNASTEKNNTILWGEFYFTYMLITEAPKYTINVTELIIHNVTIEDEGKYACFSEETALVYTVTDIIVACA